MGIKRIEAIRGYFQDNILAYSIRGHSSEWVVIDGASNPFRETFYERYEDARTARQNLGTYALMKKIPSSISSKDLFARLEKDGKFKETMRRLRIESEVQKIHQDNPSPLVFDARR